VQLFYLVLEASEEAWCLLKRGSSLSNSFIAQKICKMEKRQPERPPESENLRNENGKRNPEGPTNLAFAQFTVAEYLF
jgi:hypothetical protein